MLENYMFTIEVIFLRVHSFWFGMHMCVSENDACFPNGIYWFYWQITKGQDEPWRPGTPFTNMDKLLIPTWISYYMPIYSEVQTSRNPHIQTDIQTSKQTILSNACIRAYLYSNITRYQIQCKCSSCIFMLQTYRLTSPAEPPVYE